MKLKHLFWLVLIIAFACKQNNKQQSNYPQINAVVAQGYQISEDSVSKAKTLPAGKPSIIKAGKPKFTPTNKNVLLAGKPKISLAGNTIYNC
jgi:hypothetical protein